MADELSRDAWYALSLEYPRYSVQPVDVNFGRALYRASTALPPPVELPIQVFCDEVEDVPVLLASAGYFLFNPVGRAVVDDVALPDDVRWTPVVLNTASGVKGGCAVATASLDGGDFLSDLVTTRTDGSVLVRRLVDREKLGDRRVLVVPGMRSDNLLMRGSVVEALVDAGARGLSAVPARLSGPT
jgi:hypothetical protein